jgi:hypothetical protein
MIYDVTPFKLLFRFFLLFQLLLLYHIEHDDSVLSEQFFRRLITFSSGS